MRADALATVEERNREILAKARLRGRGFAPIVRQFGTWAVTAWGLESLTEAYDIPAEELWSTDNPIGWEGHVTAKIWVNPRDFLPALRAAREYHAGRLWPLTDLERRIVALIAEGMTEREIGNEVGYSRNTVRIRTMELKGKLGARNREHAVALAMRRGLIQ